MLVICILIGFLAGIEVAGLRIIYKGLTTEGVEIPYEPPRLDTMTISTDLEGMV